MAKITNEYVQAKNGLSVWQNRQRQAAIMQFKRAHKAMTILSQKYDLPMMSFVYDPHRGKLSGTASGPIDDLVRCSIATLRTVKDVPDEVMGFVVESSLKNAFPKRKK